MVTPEEGGTLTLEGRRQAAALADALAGKRVAHIWCSDSARCVQTAEIVAARLGVGVTTRKALREVRVGRESALAQLRDCLVERRPREPFAPLHEAGELAGRHRAGLDSRADDVVRDHVRRRDSLGARSNRLLPQRVEPAGDQHRGALEVEVALDPADTRGRQLGQLLAETLELPVSVAIGHERDVPARV